MTSILERTRKPDITFHASGRIDISAHVAKALHLTRGDVVDILTDHYDFFLYVRPHAPVNGRHEAMVFPSNKRGDHFRTSSKKLCNAVMHDSGATLKAKLCTGQPQESPRYGTIVPIITKLLL